MLFQDGVARWLSDAMRARITIEYDVPEGDRVAIREREEQRWVTSEAVRVLPRTVVMVELLDRPSLGPRPSPSSQG